MVEQLAVTRTAAYPHDRARAYCGPAHGRCWQLEAVDGPPGTVEMGVGGQRISDRLGHHPRTRLPVHDYLGNYLYVPVRCGLDA